VVGRKRAMYRVRKVSKKKALERGGKKVHARHSRKSNKIEKKTSGGGPCAQLKNEVTKGQASLCNAMYVSVPFFVCAKERSGEGARGENRSPADNLA